MTKNNSKQPTPLSPGKQLLVRSAIILVGGIILIVLIYLMHTHVNRAITLLNTPARAIVLTSFPAIETAKLADTQKRVVALLAQEYALQPPGTKYTQGAQEDWCADFTSWVMKEAGVPLLNKGNGSWRIEKTEPLLEYYQSVGLFEAAGNGYSPQVGDIAIYKKPSNFGNHVNIVIKNDNGTITTVGGNESNTIRVRVYTPLEDVHFLGYGKLPQADPSMNTVHDVVSKN